MLISITIMVIMSQQYFLYRPTIFIPMNAKNIPAPTRQPPQINILISQYTIPATTGLDIPLLICAMFFAAGIIPPAMVCTKVAIVSKNTIQSEFAGAVISHNQIDRGGWRTSAHNHCRKDRTDAHPIAKLPQYSYTHYRPAIGQRAAMKSVDLMGCLHTSQRV